MFDHQISRFEKRIADLPDQPTLAPDALKAWFDSAPEQLRQALNRVCADGKTLEERMESLVIGAYGGTVTREMLAQELQQEIAFDRAEERTGSVVTAMIEGKVADEDAYVARTYGDAPNVDGLLFVQTTEELNSGDFVRVRITGAVEYDLIGELTEDI